MDYVIDSFINDVYRETRTFDPIDIAAWHNIEIKYVPFLDNPAGQSVSVLGSPLILISDKIEESNQRYFVIAHEIYHSLQHTDLSGYYVRDSISRGKLENEANKFAIQLLIKKYKEDFGMLPNSYKELIELYGVPQNIVDLYI